MCQAAARLKEVVRTMQQTSMRLEFDGYSGARLAARLDLPNGALRAYALFAHCFTCSKDLAAVRHIAAELARSGIAILRFDFTGLGSSEGEFASTNFSSNIADLVAAAAYLRTHFQAPEILIGHSLGGAAVLAAAKKIPEVRAVATIGAPSSVSHVLSRLGEGLAAIESDGEATVEISGRRFNLSRQFVDDVQGTRLRDDIASMRKPLLVLHSPVDELVGIDNATEIFMAAKHPKSFISLDHSDHLLSKPTDAVYVAKAIVGWLARYLAPDLAQGADATQRVRVTETLQGKYQNAVQAGLHRLFADEPETMGGLDSGPSPYDYLSIGLGACTSMTLRIYAERRHLQLGRVRVDVSHTKVHASDIPHADNPERDGGLAKLDRFDRVISVEGTLTDELKKKLLEVADKCPVHRTLSSISQIVTSVSDGEDSHRT